VGRIALGPLEGYEANRDPQRCPLPPLRSSDKIATTDIVFSLLTKMRLYGDAPNITAPGLVAVIGAGPTLPALRRVLHPLVLEEFPGVVTEPCARRETLRRPAHERGVTLAHRAVWEEARRRASPFTLIFEGDAVPALPTAREAVDEAMREKVDVSYLGWCYSAKPVPPLCAHAYLLSATAVEALLASVPETGCREDGPLPPLDHLLRQTILERGLSWVQAENPRGATAHWSQGPFHQHGEEDPAS